MNYELKTHLSNTQEISEFISSEVLISKTQDMLDIMTAPGLKGSRKIILHAKNISPNFFDLKSGLAGEILQKAVNYNFKLAIIGDFENIQSDSLKAFIIESNRGSNFCFVSDIEQGLKFLS